MGASVGRVAAAVLALAADAVVLADAAAEALLALAPDAVMLAYLRSPAFLAPALLAAMLAFLRWHLRCASCCVDNPLFVDVRRCELSVALIKCFQAWLESDQC